MAMRKDTWAFCAGLGGGVRSFAGGIERIEVSNQLRVCGDPEEGIAFGTGWDGGDNFDEYERSTSTASGCVK